jgi:hypothetical protein
MRNSARRDRLVAYAERLPPQERGLVALWGLLNAVATLGLRVATVATVALSARQVWRRREAGWVRAMRTGVSRPAAAALLTANVAHQTARIWAVRELDRRAAAAAARHDTDAVVDPGD